ncbi:securin isoform X1 [Monodelphis domestica]|uniref:securin isoform X1 n=1 Tax=Monodelphis domestica TaxID=13616 RepID=UPI00044323A4|nr:securin isoform X1 [Monodelphis domestica]XP_007474031.1 securin isoform X1 [Monodelphis domestica]
MATLIYVDKENGEPGSHVAPKERVKSIKALSGRTQISTPKAGKVFTSTPALSKSVRKALGPVNRTTEKENVVGKRKEPLKQKRQNFTAKKMTEKIPTGKPSVPFPNEPCPEIENFFPFNPLEFESFDVPEEHQLSNLPLAGVPLLMLEQEKSLERLVELPPSPVILPSMAWESGKLSDLLESTSSLLSAVDDIDLPPVCYERPV